MKLRQTDKNIILYAIGILFIIGGIVGMNKMTTLKDAVDVENAALQTEVAYLDDLMKDKQKYLDQTASWNLEMDEMIVQFPANVRSEDQVMYAYSLEQSYDLLVKTLEMPVSEMVLVDAPSVAEATEETVVDDTAAADADATEQVNVEELPSANSVDITLSRARVGLGFQITYDALKSLIRQINTDAERKSIDSLDVAFDETTGNLVGTVNFNMYSLSGTDTEYSSPSVPGVGVGTDDIFKSSTTLNHKDENNAMDGNANDEEESAEGESSDDKTAED